MMGGVCLNDENSGPNQPLRAVLPGACSLAAPKAVSWTPPQPEKGYHLLQSGVIWGMSAKQGSIVIGGFTPVPFQVNPNAEK
jgi:hypothetical protein